MSDLKAMMRRIIEEAFNQGNLDALDELIADDFVEHEDLPPEVPQGRAAPRAMITMMRAAFPDLQVTVEDMLQDGSKVVTRSRFAGTHEGEFMGIAATGNKFDVPVIDIVEFRDDEAVAHWGVMDNAAMMEQLGVAGPPA
ncbi:MAG TPA: ester cyclase [Acidimicrobiales bacterium]|nr:ester cyclase [Acidimicrobiales bacterium]